VGLILRLMQLYRPPTHKP